MKRIISVILSLFIIMSCSVGYAGEMNAEFSIDTIKNSNDSKEFVLNISLPSAVEGGTLIIAFYTKGICTGIITKDVSTTSSYKIRNVKYTITPDEIKLMLWEKGRIKPLSSAQNGLTNEVYQNANKKVLELLKDTPSATNAIRAHVGEDDTSDTAVEIRVILDAIDACVKKAVDGNYGQDELLTSEYCKREFSQDLTGIMNIYKASLPATRERLTNIYNSYLEDEYVDIITNFIGFFNVKIL